MFDQLSSLRARVLLGLLPAAALLFGLAAGLNAMNEQQVRADGFGSPAECMTGLKDSSDSNLVVLDAGSGKVIDFVCIKAGQLHTGPLGNGFHAGASLSDCYEVTGVGSPTVTIKRHLSGPGCQGISHIDYGVRTVATETPTDTPTNTPTDTPTQTETVTPTLTQETQTVVVETPTPESPTPETPTPETPTATVTRVTETVVVETPTPETPTPTLTQVTQTVVVTETPTETPTETSTTLPSTPTTPATEDTAASGVTPAAPNAGSGHAGGSELPLGLLGALALLAGGTVLGLAARRR